MQSFRSDQCVLYCPLQEHVALTERTFLVGQSKVSWWMYLLSLTSDRKMRLLFKELFLGHSGCLPSEDKPLSVSVYCCEMQWHSSTDFSSSRSSRTVFVTAEAPFSTSLPGLAASGEHLCFGLEP